MKQLKDMFVETCVDLNMNPAYTLGYYDKDGYKSAHKIYMSSVDEYQAGLIICGSWGKWRKLTQQDWFVIGKIDDQEIFDGLVGWREEKLMQEKSSAKRKLIEIAENGNVVAARLLFEQDKVSGKGRPSKSDIKKAAKEAAVKEDHISGILNSYKQFKNKGAQVH